MATKRIQRSDGVSTGKSSTQDAARVAELAAFADGIERDVLLYGAALDGIQPQVEAAGAALDAYDLDARLTATDQKIAEDADEVLRDDVQGLAQIEAEMDADDESEDALIAKSSQKPEDN